MNRRTGVVAAALPLVERGWTYVATDYEGLGTGGVHPYLVGTSEGRGVLDIVRAAQQLPDSGATPDSPVVVHGHSQGGHAALMTGEIAADGFLDAHPDLPIDAVANEEWKPLVAQVADTCIDGASALAGTATGPRPTGTIDPQWNAVLGQSSPGNVVPAAPVVIVHADLDPVVAAAVSELIHDRCCAVGAARSARSTPVPTRLRADRVASGRAGVDRRAARGTSRPVLVRDVSGAAPSAGVYPPARLRVSRSHGTLRTNRRGWAAPG